ncbi:uncharacterized protein YMR196W-like [Haliotis rubra]|uniref:uncharacterized protein YMR196W-like n=1 Tax=Haliotis rubra TaxID=36100 RepID=UPI001EE5893D|nr:uncharacterized protein YMR196W-like [Haliotis rubra]
MKRGRSPLVEDEGERKKTDVGIKLSQRERSIHPPTTSAARVQWGPYLAERQWGTVREDRSTDGNCWSRVSHDAAASTAYMSGEDGLFGVSDQNCIMCTAVALWNHNDPCLKERLFGLTNPQGNHGEDVKELYYYLDNNPRHTYMKALYKYPQQTFPYDQLIAQNANRGTDQPEYELLDTRVFEDGRYWDVYVEYAKMAEEDLVCCVTVINQAKTTEKILVMPQVWFRNTWDDLSIDAADSKPSLSLTASGSVLACSRLLGQFQVDFHADTPNSGEVLFCNNETRPGTEQHGTEGLETRTDTQQQNTEQSQNQEQCTEQSEIQQHSTEQLKTNQQSTEQLNTRQDTQQKTGQSETQPDVQQWSTEHLDSGFYKDAFHRYIIHGGSAAVNPGHCGSKCADPYWLTVPPGGEKKIYWSIQNSKSYSTLSVLQMDDIINKRKAETKIFYAKLMSPKWSEEEESVAQQAVAGLLWSKQFYLYDVEKAINRLRGQDEAGATSDDVPERRVWNEGWQHINNSDIIAMPDKWEFPWYAPWDLAFHVITYIRVDLDFCQQQLELFLKDRYMKGDGQLPGCEFNLSDPNPPLHAWACLAVYRADEGDAEDFLSRCYRPLTRNFEWWVGRLSPDNLYTGGGFLGLDNISVIDRSNTPPGYTLTQADGSAWVALAALNMADISLHVGVSQPSCFHQSKHFLDIFLHIAVQMNRSVDDGGLWHPGDQFYYDVLQHETELIPIRLKSLVGLVSLFAAAVIDVPAAAAAVAERLEKCTAKEKEHVYKMEDNRYYLSLVPKSRLQHILQAVCDPDLFLSPFGVRSLAKVYEREPYSLVLEPDTSAYTVRYNPGESNSDMFGGNSNWRGPVWLCMNYLIVESLDTASEVYGNTYRIEHPTGSGHMASLADVAANVSERVVALFLPGADGVRPIHGSYTQYYTRPGWRHLLLFYEFFHAESGRGCGASHQTGWTALVLEFLYRKHGCRQAHQDKGVNS